MKRRKVTIPLAGGEILSAVLALPTAGQKGVGVITAHGAGNDMEHPLLVAFSDGLAEAGYPTMRFNFPYKEKGRKTPDRPEKLEEAWEAACRYFSEDSGVELTRIIAAGKSMGGRVASTMVSGQKLPVEGLIFLGYPLHPAGDLSKLRDAHLYRIEIPMLFFAGTKDRLCALETLQMVLAKLKAPWNLDVIEGGDHSFHIPKSMGIPESDVYARILETTVQWLEKTLGACCS
ncbi:alpha/beta family hydrolase [Syntrophus buswellii]|uniref:alpha/beta hydrolase family protein n=1 Tax=Syntrophus buswellii TaxID=43774 RepID=UPI0038D4DD5C